jgi:parallel beta-helix repeat protein
MTRSLSWLLVTLLLVSAIVFAIKVKPAKAGTLAVPDDFLTIQDAINHANEGDTVFVRTGTYYGRVIVNKTVSLVGEDRQTTIIDANKTGDAVTVAASNVVLSELKISNGFWWAISVYAGNCTISGCIVTWSGIYVESSGNRIVGNLIDWGWGPAIYLYYSNNNTIVGNTISNQWMATRSSTTFVAQFSSFSRIYHNNFINVFWYWRVAYMGSYNWWDNGCEGNYWDNYVGNDTNRDGIFETGDYPVYGKDYFPLVNPYWNPGDINHDLRIDIFDVVTIASSYGTPSSPHWNPHADIAEPYGSVNILDIVACTNQYGKRHS